MNLKHGILLSVIFLLLAFSANGIEFEACSPPGESINAASGHISSLNFPNNYDANRICTWNITVPGGKIIKLTFLNFTLVAGENDDCAGAAADSARVFITNVASHGGNPNDFKICGQKLPPPVYSEGNFIQVRFESRTGPVNKGFNATFEAIDEDSLCPTDVVLDETSGSFSTPFNPRNYPFNQTCSWKIIGKQGYHVELSLPDDNIQRCGGIACSCDYMEVQNSFSDQVPPGKLCGTPRFIPVIFYSLHESLRVVFVSDDTSMDFDGFEATYRLLNYSPPICPREAIPLSGSGEISSTNYPKSNYTASRDCTWNITAPADKIVKFTFTDFVLSECSANPCSDSCSYVELYDGGSTSSPLLGRFCQGSSWNETHLSSGNQMFVMFHPGKTVDRGFEAKYESTTTGGVDPCSEYPCANDGTCVDNEDSTFKCICPPGVTGDRCQVGLDPCSEYPCANNGTCVDNGNNTFKCICPPGVTGDLCQVDIDECRENKDHCHDICENTMGSYYCSCSDPELSVARDKRHCIAAGVEVDCGQDEMTITLPKSLLLGLDREHLRLIDANCTATENKTHFFLHTETGKCGTILKHNKDYVIYSNMVFEIPIEENKIARHLRQAMIPFDCFYSNWGAVSSIGIRPSGTKIVFSSRGFGKFTLSLDLFRSSQFIAPFSQDDFPVEFTIRERVYFETRVDSEDSTLSILALNCYATPYQDRNSQPKYDIIKDGCSVDNDDALQFHDSPDSQSQRWSLEAFQYVSNHAFVFFHCEVQICDAADPASRCARGCVQRRRRSEGVLHDNPGNKYALAQGPIALNRENREAEAVALDETKPKVNTGFNVPVIASLCVFLGFCIVGMAWLKITSDRKRVAQQFIPLYEDLQK